MVRSRSTRALAALLLVAGAVVDLSTGADATGVPGYQWSSCPPPNATALSAVPSNGGRRVALTFDDGPGASTMAILAILQRYHVRATFFNIGANEASRAADVIAEARDGFLVEDHTWAHLDLTTLTSVQQRQQIAAVATEQRALVGSSPCGLRPPYGNFNASTVAIAASMHMSVWTWDVDTQDWMARGSADPYWVRRIVSLAESEGGALTHPIVLLHDQSAAMPATVAALPLIIQYFESRHYTFVDLLGRGGPPDACATGSRFAPAAQRELGPDSLLQAGQSLVSPDGQYVLTQDTDGALTLRSGKSVTWSTPSARHPGAFTRVLASGRLAVESSTGKVLWQSDAGRAGARLTLSDDGTISLTGAATTWWRQRAPLSTLRPGSSLRAGWSLSNEDQTCRLVTQPNGQLIVQSASQGVLWTSQNSAVRGSTATFEANGNLALVTPQREVTWTSGTLGPDTSLRLSPVGRAVVSSSDGHWLWSTP